MTKHRAPKFAAVTFSMLLIGGYVYLRGQGEAPSPGGGEPAATATTAPVILPGSKSFTIDPSSTITTRPAVFYGSKSAAVIPPGEASQLLGATTVHATTSPAKNTP